MYSRRWEMRLRIAKALNARIISTSARSFTDLSILSSYAIKLRRERSRGKEYCCLHYDFGD